MNNKKLINSRCWIARPWEELLHYGLLVGAVIQLIAIVAVVVLPSDATGGDENGSSEGTMIIKADQNGGGPDSNKAKKNKDKGGTRRRKR